MRMTSVALIVLTTAAGFVVGCGEGGSAQRALLPQADGAAVLKALVVENDGQTTGLGGHAFTILQTDETVVSAADGSLAFGPASPGSLTLRLARANLLRLEAQQGGEGADHDPDDDEHADRAEVHVGRVRANERIEVRIHLSNGEMTCVRVCRQWRNERDVEIEMQRTDANDDPDMGGELELESDVYRQAIGVAVGNADPGRDLELVVIHTDGNAESQGARTVDAFGEAAWRMDTAAGDSLPFDVTDLEELEGCGVEVRDADTGDALLTATVPEMAPSAGNGDGGEDRWSGRALLTAVEPGLTGYVEIRSRDQGVCESFHMEAEGLATGRTVEFLVEDPGATGSFLSLAARTAHGSQGKAHLGLSTSHGDVLPGSVASIADLVGLGVEVRDAETGDLLLHGTVPELIAD